MVGIKLQPWAIKVLFGCDMSRYTDLVCDVASIGFGQIDELIEIACSDLVFETKVKQLEELFTKILKRRSDHNTKGIHATRLIIEKRGAISISEVAEEAGISERSLERFFQGYIGLSPKFYSRIVRFSNIFKLVKADQFQWSQIAFLAGYYDQSHFINNFKEFTGEEPGSYGFSEKTLANFFLS
jgi:transcriptional regulator GlxA family with amidase domain